MDRYRLALVRGASSSKTQLPSGEEIGDRGGEFGCDGGSSMITGDHGVDEGAGALLMNWYKQQNGTDAGQ
jgi:hypothetical protein